MEYSRVTERTQGGIGLLISKKIARYILHIKNISNRLLLVHIDCSLIITIICAYAPTGEASSSDKNTFYNNLTDCFCGIPPHSFVLLMGDLNTRVGISRYHHVSKDNGDSIIDPCDAKNMCIATTRIPQMELATSK